MLANCRTQTDIKTSPHCSIAYVYWNSHWTAFSKFQMFASINLPMSRRHLMPWLETICVLLFNDVHLHLNQYFSIFLLQRNLPQTFALLTEPYAMIHATPAQNCGCEFRPRQFRRNPWQPVVEPRLKITDLTIVIRSHHVPGAFYESSCFSGM